MAHPEITKYQDCLKSFAYPNQAISRISNRSKLDQDLAFYHGSIPDFKIDQYKIEESKAARRLGQKTQVFTGVKNDHVRNRLSHTSEVKTNASKISYVTGLNIELSEAGSLGHDLGHGPFGHLFEIVCRKMFPNLGTEFKHPVFSGICAVFIERDGDGLNLSQETLTGILNHSRGKGEFLINKNSTNESSIVMYSDKISYIFSDYSDFKRLHLISDSDIKRISLYFPGNQRNQINQCILGLVKESAFAQKITFEKSEEAQKFKEVKDIMYQYYETTDTVENFDKLERVIDGIGSISDLKGYDPLLISGLMTDNDVLALTKENKRFDMDDLKTLDVFEIIQNGCLDHTTYPELEIQLKQKIAV